MFAGLTELLLETIIDGSKLTLLGFDREVNVGDSISVNGVCLTVTQFNKEKQTVEFFVMTETFSKVVFKSRSNVELSIQEGSRVHGHYLTGHIDRTVKVHHVQENLDGSHDIWIDHNGILPKYKDSIGLNGISLTVAEVNAIHFRVSIIPHTWRMTEVQEWIPGDLINVEYNKWTPQSELSHEEYMRMALEEAERGRWTTAPNPWVGCLIVKGKQIIGRGYHQKAGTPHAEVHAVQDAQARGHSIEGSTFYVTLEPCFHHGRTPPCTDLLLLVKPKQVFIGVLDPDSRVNGKGAQILRDAGIEVISGILQDQIEYSLRSYIYHRRTGFPYCIAKIALSLDGCYALANGEAHWFTNEESRKYAHRLRAESQAIIIGSRTARIDKPQLTVRLPNFPEEHTQPKRVVVHSGDDLERILDDLGKSGVLQCLIEGGGRTHDQFFKRNLIRELYIQESPRPLILPGIRWHDVVDLGHLTLQLIEMEKLGDDNLRHYRVTPNSPHMEKILTEIRNGRPVVVMDNEERENEGDLFVPAEKMTPQLCTLFVKNGSGIICTPMTKLRAMQLGLPSMVELNEDRNRTNFTVSCDLKGVKTGVSSTERAQTILSLASGDSRDLSRPGHVFPLVAEYGGLQLREGHTEASLVLCQLAGVKEVGAIVELVKKDGEMMRLPDCQEFARSHGLELVTIPEIKQYLSRVRPRGKILSSCQLKTDYGAWDLFCYGEEILLIQGKFHSQEPVLTRIHSECYTGDILYSRHCDCGKQLAASMEVISSKGAGLIILPAHQEGRGIGLTDKILAYRLQQKEGLDTYQANIRLGFSEDQRDYRKVREILDYLGVSQIDLLTSDLGKITALEGYIHEVIPLICKSAPESLSYLEAKKSKGNQ